MVSFLVGVPNYFFSDSRLSVEARKILTVMFADYTLLGSLGYEDDGQRMAHTFEEVPEAEKFSAPTVMFIVFKEERIDIHDLLVILYLHYLANKSKKTKVKVKVDVIAKAIGISKTKVKSSLQRLDEIHMDFLKFCDEKDTYELPLIDAEKVETFNEMLSMAAATQESGDTFPVPDEFMKNYDKMGFSTVEFAILLHVMSRAHDNKSTMEEIINEILKKSRPDEEISELFIRSAIKKAEEKGVFKLVKGRNGVMQILFL